MHRRGLSCVSCSVRGWEVLDRYLNQVGAVTLHVHPLL